MRKSCTFLFLLSTLVFVGSALYAEDAAEIAQGTLPAPETTPEMSSLPAGDDADCPEATPTSTELDFEGFASSLDGKSGAENRGVCTPEYRTIYTCDCNSGQRFRRRNQYRECCGISCDPWQTTSSSCTNYTC